MSNFDKVSKLDHCIVGKPLKGQQNSNQKLVVSIFLVALILIPYNIPLFLSSQKDVIVGKGKAQE